jgi:hypothetical protein
METERVPLQLQCYILVSVLMYLWEKIETYPGINQLLRNPHLYESTIVLFILTLIPCILYCMYNKPTMHHYDSILIIFYNSYVYSLYYMSNTPWHIIQTIRIFDFTQQDTQKGTPWWWRTYVVTCRSCRMLLINYQNSAFVGLLYIQNENAV